jgi:hypothetical protein
LEVWLLDRLQKQYPHGGVWALVRAKKYFFVDANFRLPRSHPIF